MTEAKKPEMAKQLQDYLAVIGSDILRKTVEDYADACVAHATAEKDATIKRLQELLEKVHKALEVFDAGAERHGMAWQKDLRAAIQAESHIAWKEACAASRKNFLETAALINDPSDKGIDPELLALAEKVIQAERKES